MSCGGSAGTLTYRDGHSDSFFWISTTTVDLDEPVADSERWDGKGNHLLAAAFTAKAADPTTGSGTDTVTSSYTGTSGCTANEHSSRTYEWRASTRDSIPELFVGTGDEWPLGAFLYGPRFQCTARPEKCADDPSHWFQLGDASVVVPLRVDLGGVGETNLGPWKVSYPHDVQNPTPSPCLP
jgi:hypothetical protein